MYQIYRCEFQARWMDKASFLGENNQRVLIEEGI
jgi:hypothetical protein